MYFLIRPGSLVIVFKVQIDSNGLLVIGRRSYGDSFGNKSHDKASAAKAIERVIKTPHPGLSGEHYLPIDPENCVSIAGSDSDCDARAK